jgi:hypothetical protein
MFARNYDWWVLAHLSARTRFCFIPDKLTRWRIHRTSSHFGPAKVPFADMRRYLLAMYDSLLAGEEVRRHEAHASMVRAARDTVSRVDRLARQDRKRLLLLMLRYPLVSFCFLADAALRRVLFA